MVWIGSPILCRFTSKQGGNIVSFFWRQGAVEVSCQVCIVPADGQREGNLALEELSLTRKSSTRTPKGMLFWSFFVT